MTPDLLHDLLKAIEQQLASPETPYVREAFERLTKLGLPETEAKTQLALCLGNETDNMLRSKRPFDEASYRAALVSLRLPDDSTGEDP